MKIGRSRVMLIAAEENPWFSALNDPMGVLRISSDRDDRMGTKLKTPKNPSGFKQNPKNSLDQNLTPKRSHAEFLSHIKYIHRTTQLGYVGTITYLQILLNTPKKPPLNQATQKKYLPKFSNPKNPEIKNFKPNKIL